MREFRLELSDRSFSRLEFLDNEYSDLDWEFNQIGGCGSLGFRLPRQFCQELNIAANFNIKLHRRAKVGTGWNLWWQGLVENKSPHIESKKEFVNISCQGYSTQLNRIHVDRNYGSQELSITLKHILDNDIVPNTNITYDAGDIQATSFTANSLEFNINAKEAVQTIADLSGYEWGVNKDRKFYFKAKSSTVSHRFVLGGKVVKFFTDDVAQDIVNRVIIKGGNVAGSPFTATYNDTQSQLKWGRYDKFVSNSAIVTAEVAQQYANAIFNEKSTIVRRGSMQVVDLDDRIEETLPIPLMEMVSRGVAYGERKYGTFLYSGRINYFINKASYKYGNDGVLTTNLSIGVPTPSIGETIAQIEHKLRQEQSAGL